MSTLARNSLVSQIEDTRIKQIRETLVYFHSLNEELGEKMSEFFSEESQEISIASVKQFIEILENMKRLARSEPATQLTLHALNHLMTIWLTELKNAFLVHQLSIEEAGDSEEEIDPMSALAIIFRYAKNELYLASASATVYITSLDNQLSATKSLQPSLFPYSGKSGGLRGLISRVWTGGVEE